MASFVVVSSAAVADPCPAPKAVPLTKASPLPSPSPSRMICISQTPRIGFRATGLRLKSISSIAAANTSRRYKQCLPVCLFGGKGKSEGDSEDSPWKSLEKAIGNFNKGSSVEDVLRKQIEKQEYFDDGGGGMNPPRGGGGGGGSGGTEDEGLSGFMEEALQVFLATAAFVLLYIYLLDGEEMVRLIKDFIKYLFGGQPSLRLQRVLSNWRLFLNSFSRKEEVLQKDWLEQAIAGTPTWWDSPEKYRRLRRRILGSASSSSRTKRQSSSSSSSSYVSSSFYE